MSEFEKLRDWLKTFSCIYVPSYSICGSININTGDICEYIVDVHVGIIERPDYSPQRFIFGKGYDSDINVAIDKAISNLNDKLEKENQ